MVLDINQLMELEEALSPRLQNDLTGLLAKLNREERLEEFCQLIGADDLLGKPEDGYQTSKTGLIVVIGESQVEERKMQGVLKDVGIRKERLECCLGYEAAKSFPYTKLQYQSRYALVLVGSMGHKAKDIGSNSSAISMMENTYGYPKVIRLGTNELKITKSNFKKAIEDALRKGVIIPG